MGISNEDRIFLKKLGKRIRDIRKDKGLTQAELGFRCDMEKPSIGRIEIGGTNPTILTIKKICRELEIQLDEFFKEGGDDL